MPVLDTPAMGSITDVSFTLQDSSVRDSGPQASTPEQTERRYPFKERKPPQRFYLP